MDKLEIEISTDICALNRWHTPIRINNSLGRDLSPQEILVAMDILKAYAPGWLSVWNSKEAPVRENKGEV